MEFRTWRIQKCFTQLKNLIKCLQATIPQFPSPPVLRWTKKAEVQPPYPPSWRFGQLSAHIDHLSVGKYDKFRGTTIATWKSEIKKDLRENQKRMHINIGCEIQDARCTIVYLYLADSASVLLWHKPIKPRLIGHVKWRNRARTQVWHFIIISTAWLWLYQSCPVAHDRSICICCVLQMYLCIPDCICICAPIEMPYDRYIPLGMFCIIVCFDMLISCDNHMWPFGIINIFW